MGSHAVLRLFEILMNTQLEFIPWYSYSVAGALVVMLALAYLVARLLGGAAASLARHAGILALRTAFVAMLLAMFANPTRVSEVPGAIRPAEMLFLLDASQSMALDDAGVSRWDRALQSIHDATSHGEQSLSANVRLFRFGRQLDAVDVSLSAPAGPSSAGTAQNAGQPTEADTQLSAALREAVSRFGKQRPAGVVVISDGRIREPAELSDIAARFAQLGVPIHVLPCGDASKGGDVAIVSLIIPATVRKNALVNVQALVRSHGFGGRRGELKLHQLDPQGRPAKQLTSAPLTLQDGVQVIDMHFPAGEDDFDVRAWIRPQPAETSEANNAFVTDFEIDRNHIRLLYLDGDPPRYANVESAGQVIMRGPHVALQQALEGDQNIDCTVLSASEAGLAAPNGLLDAFPISPIELASFDAIILNNVPRSSLTDEQCQWLEEWVRARGGGFCMVGGAASFGDEWARPPLGPLFSATSLGNPSWRPALTVKAEANLAEPLHPILCLTDDSARNRELWRALPLFRGGNASLTRSDFANVLATAVPTSDSEVIATNDGEIIVGFPAIATGRYGRGRTLAMAVAMTGADAQGVLNWGGRGRQHYARFWRNVVYWLSEDSLLVRKRLVVSTDKRVYSPGETIRIRAEAYDANATPTLDYRLKVAIEPQSASTITDYAPIHWPSDQPRAGGVRDLRVAWGEELELPARSDTDRGGAYELALAIAEASAIEPNDGDLRLELTAYDGAAQVDSASIPIHVLNDPFEQRNPFPDHELLANLAESTGGDVLSSPEALRDLLLRAPTTKGAPEVKRTPAWNNWWVLLALFGLLGAEWLLRRRIGLA